MYKNIGRSRGFTLIELLVVVAIIGILSSVVLASLNSARQKGRDARRISDIKQLQLALELYYDAYSSYPTGTTISGVLDPSYISVIPTDPTNSGTYVYSYQGLTSASGACSTTPCPSYVLRARLETNHTALNGDIDGTVVLDCSDTSTAYFYCVRP